MKRFKICLLLATSFCFLSCTNNHSTPYPSDHTLIDNFFSQESAFSSLISDPDNQNILERLGIIDVYSLNGKMPVHTFIVWRQDLFGPGGFSKGYYYSELKPDPLVDNIDEIYNQRPADQVEAFRLIKAPWYIYYSSSN